MRKPEDRIEIEDKDEDYEDFMLYIEDQSDSFMNY